MPIFNHQCDSCGREEQVMTRSVAESPVWPQCCGEGMPRVHRSNRRHTGVFEKPIEMYSVALADETDIAVFRGRNPGVDVSTDRRSPLFGCRLPELASRSSPYSERRDSKNSTNTKPDILA